MIPVDGRERNGRERYRTSPKVNRAADRFSAHRHPRLSISGLRAADHDNAGACRRGCRDATQGSSFRNHLTHPERLYSRRRNSAAQRNFMGLPRAGVGRAGAVRHAPFRLHFRRRVCVRREKTEQFSAELLRSDRTGRDRSDNGDIAHDCYSQSAELLNRRFQSRLRKVHTSAIERPLDAA